MSKLRIFQKYGFFKITDFSKLRTFSNGEFLKRAEFFEKHGILCQNYGFFENYIFLKSTYFYIVNVRSLWKSEEKYIVMANIGKTQVEKVRNLYNYY